VTYCIIKCKDKVYKMYLGGQTMFAGKQALSGIISDVSA
jgi:hypothetical protein